MPTLADRIRQGRRAGYNDEELLTYVAGTPNAGAYSGTDEQKIQQLMQASGGKQMLPYEYAPSLDLPAAPRPPLPAELGGPETPRLNPRTGLPMRQTYVPVLDDPLIGATEIAGGTGRFQEARTGNERAAALSEIVRGGMRAGTPLLPAAAVAAPWATLG